MPSNRPITLLHLSDTQFGRNHRFEGLDLPPPDNSFDTLLERLKQDLRGLTKDHGLRPDLVVLSGDMAECGLKSEFEDLRDFLGGLIEYLGLPPERVVMVPGNHDINRKACQAYFFECESQEEQPTPPFWPKWRDFVNFFNAFYPEKAGIVFTEKEPWTLFEIPELRLAVAGLNSTMRESYRDEDHYGWVGEAQLRWFAERLEAYRQKGWLRIGVVHHNVRHGPTADDENLRDAGDLARILGDYLNILLHGHTHDGKLDWLTRDIPILSTGSAALTKEARPEEIPNQYQIIRLWPDRLAVGAGLRAWS